MYQIEKIQNQRLLISFLNWGKGHLSRCIGLCRQLKEQDNQLFIACTAEEAEIMNAYLGDFVHLPFEGYPFHFTGNGNFANDLWNNRKELAAFLYTEQTKVEELVKAHAIDFVISDHRYGFRSTHVPSIFVTHQVQLAIKWWQFPAQWIHKAYMNQFSYTWIMDDENNSLAGKLSKRMNDNSTYIGHYSRFQPTSTAKDLVIGVVNGPKPYDEQLLKKLLEDPNIKKVISSIPSYDHRVIEPQNWQTVDEIFERAKTIYGYCGYSTLMDLKVLKTKGVLVATPGQTEQEYLVKLHPTQDFS